MGFYDAAVATSSSKMMTACSDVIERQLRKIALLLLCVISHGCQLVLKLCKGKCFESEYSIEITIHN